MGGVCLDICAGVAGAWDEVVVLCDQRAQGFVMEQTGARPELPESIWHRMGDRAGPLKRYLRVPGHAIATFFAMPKVFREQFSAQPATAPEAQALDTRRVRQWNVQPVESEKNTPPAKHIPTGSTLDSGEAPDWIFVPTVLVHHLLGWWLLLRAGSVPGDSRVLLFFPNLPIRLDDQGQPHWTGGPTTKLIAWLFENLRGEVENGKVVLGVETHAMRRALEGLIRMPVVYLPHPVEAQGGTSVERRESSKCEDVLTTTGKAGALEEEHPKVGPKGEGVGTSESKDTEATEDLESGLRLAGQAGASEPDSLTSKLADAPVSESLIRFADGPAEALDAGRSTLDTEASASVATGRLCGRRARIFFKRRSSSF